jgi:hypothetical protein
MKTIGVVLALLTMSIVGASASATAMANEGELINEHGETLKKANFTGKSGTLKLETVGSLKVTCGKTTSTGKITSQLEGEETLAVSECTDSQGEKCGNESKEKEGKGIFTLLIQLLRNIATAVVLLARRVVAGKSEVIICGSTSDKLEGGFLTPVGTSQQGTLKTTYTFQSKQTTKGVQEPVAFTNDSSVKVSLKLEYGASTLEQASQVLNDEVTFEERAEFRK